MKQSTYSLLWRRARGKRGHNDDRRRNRHPAHTVGQFRVRGPNRGGRQSDDRQQGDMEISIGHRGVLHEAHVAEAHYGEQRDAEEDPSEPEGCDGVSRLLPGLRGGQQCGGHASGPGKRNPPTPVARVDVPTWIDERQIERPDRLMQVEPHNSASPEHAIDKIDAANDLLRIVRLEPHVHCGEADADGKKREDSPQIAPLQRPFPPQDAKKQCRQHHRGAFSKHRQHEGRETQPIPGAGEFVARKGRCLGQDARRFAAFSGRLIASPRGKSDFRV